MPTRRVFVGRKAELAALHGHLRSASTGSSAPVVIEGPAGIGKTALLSEFLSRCRSDATVLLGTGAPDEQDIPGGLADQLLRGATVHGEPGGQHGGPGSQNRGATRPDWGPRLLDMLDRTARTGTVVLAVDDAQWVDPQSLAALLYAVRRLPGGGLLTLLVTRPPQDPRLEPFLRLTADDPAFHLRLDGLPADQIAALARAFAGHGLTSGLAERLAAHTQGNPRHAAAILSENPGAVLHAAGPLPAPRSIAASIGTSLERCPEPGRALVAATAVLGPSCPLSTAAALAEVPDAVAAVEAATRSGLLGTAGAPGATLLSFPDPLIRSAVYHHLSPSERRDLHARAIALAPPEDRLSHRVACAATEDETLATELSERALADADAGTLETAADRMRAAAGLSTTERGRAARLQVAVHYLVQAHETTRAAELLDETPSDAAARSLLLQAAIACDTGDLDRAEVLLDAAWNRCGDDAPLLAAIAARRATVAALRLRTDEMCRWLATGPPDPTTLDRLPMALLVSALAMTRGRRAANDLVRRWTADRPDHWRLPEARGAARLWSDDPDGARADLTTARQRLQHRGRRADELAMLPVLFLACFRSGQWAPALALAEEALVPADRVPTSYPAQALHCCAALVLAARGNCAAAQRHLTRVAPASSSPPMRIVSVVTSAVTAFLAWSQDEPRRVLQAAATLDQPTGQPDPRTDGAGAAPDIDLLTWPVIAAEALLALDRPDEAHHTLDRYTTTHGDRPTATAAIARATGKMHLRRGEIDDAQRSFEGGLSAAVAAGWPYGEALLHLELGALLRRAGRRRAAAAHLETARITFTSLGAADPTRRAVRELASCGLHPHRRDGTAERELTPTELSTARLAAGGMTNREIANELVVSIKTVEFHLARVFRKLGLTSRHELAGRLDTPQDGSQRHGVLPSPRRESVPNPGAKARCP